MKYFYTAFFTCTLIVSFAQQQLHYTHYYINPFLYNPSYAARENHHELTFNFRRQWADIDGGPVTNNASAHFAINHKIAVALTGISDNAGVLKTSFGLATVAYRVYFGHDYNEKNHLAFGLSAGMMNSGINASDTDVPDDPAIGKETTAAAQFGMHYQLNGLRLSLALPTLLAKQAQLQGVLDQNFSLLNHTIIGVSYQILLGETLIFEPQVIHQRSIGSNSSVQAIGTFFVGEKFWFGGSYFQDLSANAFVGAAIKNVLRVSYGYGVGISAISSPTHDVQISFRFGAKRSKPLKQRSEQLPELHSEPKAQEPIQAAVPTTVEQVHLPDGPADEIEIAPDSVPSIQETDPLAEQNLIRSSGVKVLEPGFYVVVGAFRFKSNAIVYSDKLKKAGYPASVNFHPGKQLYIIHMLRSETVDEARKMTLKYQKMSRYSFRDTWILKIPE